MHTLESPEKKKGFSLKDFLKEDPLIKPFLPEEPEKAIEPDEEKETVVDRVAVDV